MTTEDFSYDSEDDERTFNIPVGQYLDGFNATLVDMTGEIFIELCTWGGATISYALSIWAFRLTDNDREQFDELVQKNNLLDLMYRNNAAILKRAIGNRSVFGPAEMSYYVEGILNRAKEITDCLEDELPEI